MTFGFLAPEEIQTIFDLERTWSKLFQKRVVRKKKNVDIKFNAHDAFLE